MSYVVLARKWRPMKFDELVGQSHIAQTLTNAIQSGQISHGYLFTGTRGVGKTTAARILTKALNCDSGPRPDPCGICDSCKSIGTGHSMSVLEIDGASNRGVDDIRELREQVKYAPMNGKHKVYIIDEVHMLTKEAFNALLKTLEEPPPNVVFIFATTEIRKVPQTIQSRVQRFDFKRISETKIRKRLEYICEQENITAECEGLEAISVRAGGSMRDALSMLDQVYAYSGSQLTMEAVRSVLSIPPQEMFDELCSAVIGHDQGRCFSILSDFYDLGAEISEVLAGFGQYLRNMFFAMQKGITAKSLGINDSHFQKLQELAKGLQDGDIIRYSKIISDLLFEIRTAANPRLTIEMGMARLASLDRVITLTQLLDLPPSSLQEGKKKNEPLIQSPAQSFQDAPSGPIPPPPDQPPPEFSRYGSPEIQTEAPPPPDSSPQKNTEAPAEEPPAENVPSQPGLKELIEVWQDIIQEMMGENPMLAGCFTETTLELSSTEPPILTVLFTKPSTLNLVMQDRENLVGVKAVLKSKLSNPVSFSLVAALKELQPAQEQGETCTEPGPASHFRMKLTEDELVQKDPVIRNIFELFEGKLVN